MRLLLPLLSLASSGCFYRIGQGVIEGAFDEVHGKGRSGGISHTADLLLERQVMTELGHQLGQGLTSGAADFDPDQKAALEKTIDDLITVATRRAGKGLRTEVSPELREMIEKDVIGALSEGFRGELGDSLEETVDRVVARAIGSLKTSLQDADLEMALSDLLRDSVHYAMREGAATPAIGETLEDTLTEHMLMPIESSVGGLTEVVAQRVDASARRTENTLRGVIGALVVVTSVIAMLYFIRNRQVRRLQEQNTAAERGLKNIDAALALLDTDTRSVVLAKLQEYEAVEQRPQFVPRVVQGTPPAPRSDEYQRRR
ncbi:MAG: hypothetical protein ABMB14_03120 [Myxococcota bacterium]